MPEAGTQVDRRAGVWLAAATVIGYVALLGWDQHYDYNPATQTYSGPYQTWQVVALIVFIGFLAAGAGWAGHARTAFVAIPVVLTIIWSWDAAWVGDESIFDKDDTDPSLWPVGAVMLAGASFAGVWVAAKGAALLRTLPNRGPGDPHQSRPTSPGHYPYQPTAVRRTTNGMAIASMVLGILWVNSLGSVLALLFGYVARRQIRQRDQAGDGMAIAGIVLGWIGVGAFGLILILTQVRASSGH